MNNILRMISFAALVEVAEVEPACASTMISFAALVEVAEVEPACVSTID